VCFPIPVPFISVPRNTTWSLPNSVPFYVPSCLLNSLINLTYKYFHYKLLFRFLWCMFCCQVTDLISQPHKITHKQVNFNFQEVSSPKYHIFSWLTIQPPYNFSILTILCNLYKLHTCLLCIILPAHLIKCSYIQIFSSELTFQAFVMYVLP